MLFERRRKLVPVNPLAFVFSSVVFSRYYSRLTLVIAELSLYGNIKKQSRRAAVLSLIHFLVLLLLRPDKPDPARAVLDGIILYR